VTLCEICTSSGIWHENGDTLVSVRASPRPPRSLHRFNIYSDLRVRTRYGRVDARP
jgi:hypothetical protein